MSTFKDILSFMGLIGLPSLSGIIIWLYKSFKKEARRQTAIERGVQAILRSQMINDYNKWFVNKHYAPIWAKQNFENVWIQYEALGQNGVMDGVHRDFMSLPTEPPEQEEGRTEFV